MYSKNRENHTMGLRIRIISVETIKNIISGVFSRIQQKYIHTLNPSDSWLSGLLRCIVFSGSTKYGCKPPYLQPVSAT